MNPLFMCINAGVSVTSVYTRDGNLAMSCRRGAPHVGGRWDMSGLQLMHMANHQRQR
jgi:hypothetical protein